MAVKCNNVFYLPPNHFLNPGLRYTQAVQLMAAKLQFLPHLMIERR